ncbi:MAG: anhydro-N-acetylmuramic acid kinase [Pseudoxanthomonas suwonensis]|nr:anhydro-N-acetylmuramic acid kinase [Pseudoxanthomonas suwonensis]
MRAHDAPCIGLMSGTSADGIDAALVRFRDEDGRLQAELLGTHTEPWDEALRTRLIALGQGGALESLDELGLLDARVGEAFAAAANALLHQAGVAADAVAVIGSHGQTIRHRPAAEHPFSMQIGDAARIAERTGITTVADFRRRDIAAGGQGAPLLPALHQALLHDRTEERAVLNLGGIANLTLLPSSGTVRGFDTGPANALLDAWCHLHTGHRFDRDGAFAAQGRVDDALLQRLLAEPWFATLPPKSTGREQFRLDWLSPRLSGNETAADVQATLLALTARTVADALRATQAHSRRLLVCGGGVHNPVLMAALAAELPGVTVQSTATHGIDPDHMEAIGFAWLARQNMLGLAGNLPAVTGAGGPRVLGCIHPAG